MLGRIVLLLALCPSPVFAQRVVDAAVFVETAAPAAVRSGIGGELAYGRSVIQLRVSGRTGSLDRAGEPRFWRADADLKLAPLNVHRSLRGLVPYDVEPYVFVGGGARREEATDGAGTRYDPSLSWGAGGRLPVIGRMLALYGEGRSRGGEWEARGGVTLRFTFGSGRAAPAPVAAFEDGPARPARAAGLAGDVLAEAERHLGVPYAWGGDGPETGFDCSGFVRFVYAKAGIALPRITRDQAKVGSTVPLERDSFRPGDLLFFASDGRRIDHVAIYAGDGRIIHAPNGSTHVRYDDLRAPEARWYRERLVEARRVF